MSAPQQRTERQRADPTEIGADAGRMCWLPCQKAREDAHVQIAAFPWAAALRADGPWSGRLVPLTQRRTPRSRCTNVWRKLYPGRYIPLIPASHRRHHHIIPKKVIASKNYRPPRHCPLHHLHPLGPQRCLRPPRPPYAESQSVPPTTSYTQARATHSPLVLAPSPPQSQAPALRPPHDRPTEVYWKDLLNPTPAPMRMEIPPLAPDEYFIEPEGSNLLACLRPSATLEPPATSSSRWVYYPDGKPDGSIQENIGTVRKHRASPRARGSAGANRRTRHKTRDANSSDSDAAYRGDTEEGREGQHGPVRGLSKDRCTSRAHNRSRQPRERAYSPYPSTSPRKTSR